jgi:hypothetical protein
MKIVAIFAEKLYTLHYEKEVEEKNKLEAAKCS